MTERETFGMAKNPHIIVDEKTNRCLCGIYGDQAITCGDIIAELRPMAAVAWRSRHVIAHLSKEIPK